LHPELLDVRLDGGLPQALAHDGQGHEAEDQHLARMPLSRSADGLEQVVLKLGAEPQGGLVATGLVLRMQEVLVKPPLKFICNETYC